METGPAVVLASQELFCWSLSDYTSHSFKYKLRYSIHFYVTINESHLQKWIQIQLNSNYCNLANTIQVFLRHGLSSQKPCMIHRWSVQLWLQEEI